jgi:sugar-specific transcriptional regulator TrmB
MIRSPSADGLRSAAVPAARHPRASSLPSLPSSSRDSRREGTTTELAAMTSNLVQGLSLFGIPAREGRLYLALATGGPMGARQAMAAAHLHRATAYRMILRLLSRGLVVSDGSWPQRFGALSFYAVYERMQSFLKDEQELRRWSAACYGMKPIEALASASIPPFEIVCSRGAQGTRILQELDRCRDRIDVMFRPLSVAAAFRSGVARVLARALMHGVRVRLLLDASPADRRFLDRVARESEAAATQLEVRHFGPLAGHFYVLDSRKVIRFSVLGNAGRAPEVGLLSVDASYVRSQISRFESVWAEAMPARVRVRSTRSYGLVPPRNRSESLRGRSNGDSFGDHFV